MRTCLILGCDRARLKWVARGASIQTRNGFFTVTTDGGNYICPNCGGHYGGKRLNREQLIAAQLAGFSPQQRDAILSAVNERESLRTALKNAVNEMEAAIIAYESMGYHSLAIGTKKRITTANKALKGE